MGARLARVGTAWFDEAGSGATCRQKLAIECRASLAVDGAQADRFLPANRATPMATLGRFRLVTKPDWVVTKKWICWSRV